MPLPIADLLRMPKGTRELYPLAEGDPPAKFQRLVMSYTKKPGTVKLESVIVVNPKDKSVMDAVWVEVLDPNPAKKSPAGRMSANARLLVDK